jgi:hypothetical protein
MYISYVAENSQTKEQHHVGTIHTIQYFKKWMSEISEGNKFSMALDLVLIQQGSMTRQEQVYGKKTQILLQEFIRARLRGVDYEYGFEIVLNKEPALEKSATLDDYQ